MRDNARKNVNPARNLASSVIALRPGARSDLFKIILMVLRVKLHRSEGHGPHIYHIHLDISIIVLVQFRK